MKRISTILFLLGISISWMNGLWAQNYVTIGNSTTSTQYNPIYINGASAQSPFGNSISIFKANEIGSQGFLSAVAWYKVDTNAIVLTNATLKIYIKHTTLNSLPSNPGTFASQLTNATLVYDSSWLGLPADTGWMEFVFDKQFGYNGVDNLMIMVAWYIPNASVYDVSWYFSSSPYMANTWAGNTSSPYYIYGTGHRPNTRMKIFPFLSQDAGITAISAPNSYQLPDTIDMVVKLRNWSYDTLTSVNIGWSVNGVVQSPYIWTGNLSPLQEDSNVICGNYFFPPGSYTIQAWTYLPNGQPDLNTTNDTCMKDVITCFPLAGSFTIGGYSADFQSIQTAIETVAHCGIAANVTFNIQPGIYEEQLLIPWVPGTSDTSKIILQSATGNAEDVIIRHVSQSGINYTIMLDGASFIELHHLSVYADDFVYARVIVLANGASDNKINSCRLISNSHARVSSQSDVIYSGPTVEQRNIISHNLILNGYYGINFIASSNLEEGNIIEGNIISEFSKIGIICHQQRSIRIANNIINNYVTSNTAAIGINVIGSVEESIIDGNRVKLTGNSSLTGISASVVALSDTFPGMTINNIIHIIGSSGQCTGISIMNAKFHNIFHNSVIIQGSSAASKVCYINYCTSIIRLINNHLISYGIGYAVRIAGSFTLISDYNNMYTQGPILGNFGFIDVNDLAGWKLLTGQDNHSHSIDPYLFDTKFYVPVNYMTNNLGTPLDLVPFDIFGHARDSLHPDIGALEFTPASNDACLRSIDAPASIVNHGLVDIKVTLQNYGIAPLTSVLIYYALDTISPASYLWTGNLSTVSIEGPVAIGNVYLNTGNHLLRVWTSLPNGQPDSNNYNDTLAINIKVCAAHNGTYTIGQQGSGADFSSIQASIDALSNCGISGPVVLNVLPGTYNEQLIIPQVPGVSMYNTITLQSSTAVASDVIIQYTPTSSNTNWVLRLDGAQYTTIQYMTIRTGLLATSLGIVVELANGAAFNHIHANIVESIPGGKYTTAVGIYSGITKEDNNIISSNTVRYGLYRINITGLSLQVPEEGNVIIGNTVGTSTESGYGIKAQFQKNFIINSNTINEPSDGINIANCTENIWIEKNRILLTPTGISGANGISLSGVQNTEFTPTIVANNFITIYTTSSVQMRWLSVSGSGHFYLYNNSMYASGTSNLMGVYLSSGAIYLKNNLMANYSGYGNLLSLGTMNVLKECDHNIYYTNSSQFNSLASTLPQWQTLSGLDSNSIIADPMFRTPQALYPTNYSIDNLGIPISSISDDIDGNPRNPITPDVGAAEFSQPLVDAGVKTITNPPTLISEGISPISATIKNYGLNDLTYVTLNWNINNGAITTQPWFGNLVTNQESGNISLGNHYFTPGQHIVKIWTSNPNSGNDGNPYNDTSALTVNACEIMIGTYTIGDSTCDFLSFNDAITGLLSCGIAGTVVFNVKPGTYNEQVSIPEISGSSASHRIVFQSMTGNWDDVILQHLTSSLQDYVLRFDGAKYITIRNLSIKVMTGAVTGQAIILTNQANYNEISNNKILCITSPTINMSGINCNHEQCDYNTIQGNIITGGNFGIRLVGTSNPIYSMGNIIEENHFSEYSQIGIHAEYQVGVKVRKNYVESAKDTGSSCGIHILACINDNEVSSNFIKYTGMAQSSLIYLRSSDATSQNPGIISNNILLQTNPSAIPILGIYQWFCENLKYYHNTVIFASSDPQAYPLCLIACLAEPEDIVDILNNQFIHLGGGKCFFTNVIQIIDTMDHNNMYTTGPNMGTFNNIEYSSLSDWNTAYGHDLNSVSLDPIFIAPWEVTPSNLALNNLGFPTGIVQDDYYGNLRNPTNPDIGAVEFNPQAYEAAILSLTSPAGGCGMGIEPVTIRIRNGGFLTINGGLTASYQVEGTTNIVTDTITAVILSGDTIDYVFNTPIDMTSKIDTAFRIETWINLANDSVSHNDTINRLLDALQRTETPLVTDTTIQFGHMADLAILNVDPYSIYSWYNAPTGVAAFHTDTVLKTPSLCQTTVYWVDGIIGTGPGVLPTTMMGGNWSNGNMFDVSVAYPATIDSFNVNASSGTLQIYYKPGSYIGFENNPGAWTLAGEVVITGSNYGSKRVNIGGISLLPGQAYGFYVTMTSSMLIGTNGILSNEFYTDNNMSIQTGPAVLYPFGAVTQNKVFNGTVYYTSGNSCRSLRVPDTVFVTPQVVFVSAGNDEIACSGDTVQLGTSVTGGVAPFTYYWSPATSLSNHTISNPLAYPQDTTIYTITVTDQNGELGTDEVKVLVIPPPFVILPPFPMVYLNTPPFELTTGIPTGGTYSGKGVSGGYFYPSLADPGTHSITYIYADSITGCKGSAVSTIFVNPGLGLNTNTSASGCEIFPNPSHGSVLLSIHTNDKYMYLEVMDIQGKVVAEDMLQPASGRHELDFHRLPRGVYQLRLHSEHDIFTSRLILH